MMVLPVTKHVCVHDVCVSVDLALMTGKLHPKFRSKINFVHACMKQNDISMFMLNEM